MIHRTIFVNQIGIQLIQMSVLLHIYQHIAAAYHRLIIIAVQRQILAGAFQ